MQMLKCNMTTVAVALSFVALSFGFNIHVCMYVDYTKDGTTDPDYMLRPSQR